MSYAPTEIPVGIESAAHRFAASCLRDGWDGAVVLTCSGGTVDCMTHATGKGNCTDVLIEGDWFEWSGDSDAR